jgi:hypothetical protein
MREDFQALYPSAAATISNTAQSARVMYSAGAYVKAILPAENWLFPDNIAVGDAPVYSSAGFIQICGIKKELHSSSSKSMISLSFDGFPGTKWHSVGDRHQLQ